MAYSLNAIVSQILADSSSNLNVRTDLNREHVCDALMQMLATMIRDWHLKGVQVDMVRFCTVIPGAGLPVRCGDFTYGGLLLGEHVTVPEPEYVRAFGLPVEQLRAYVRLPRLMLWGGSKGLGYPAVNYLGSIDGREKLDIYTGEDWKYAPHNRYTGHHAFAWLQDNVAWLFSPRPIRWRELLLRGVLADFRDMAEFGREYDFDETPCPWPDDVSNDLVTGFANRYISMYGRAGKGQPADGNLPAL